MKKKLLAILCILSMCVPMLSPAMVMDVHAEESEKVQTVTSSYNWVNPIYKDVVKTTDVERSDEQPSITPFSTRSVTYFSDTESAGAELRAGLVERQSEITIGYQTTEAIPMGSTEEETAARKEWFGNKCDEMFSYAYAHTQVPEEGDSLRFVVGKYTAGSSIGMTNGTYKIEITFCPTYYTTAEQEQELSEAVDSVLGELNLEGKTNYEKVKAIYDYMCDNITYDYDGLEAAVDMTHYTAWKALCQKTAVCQGYAVLFYRLALEAGVNARVITGIGNGGGHAWNIVKLGKNYYCADATWDINYKNDDNYQYFLRCPDNFTDHTSDEQFLTEEFTSAYPIATSDYMVGSEEPEEPSEPEVETTVSVYINEAEGTKFICLDGTNLTDVLTKGDEKNEYLVEVGTTLEFKTKVESGYVLRFESYVGPDGGGEIPIDESKGCYSITATSGPIQLAIHAEKLLEYEDVYENYFSTMGYAWQLGRTYFSAEQTPEAEMVFFFLNAIGAVGEYEDASGNVTIDYDRFMGIAREYFLNPCDMLDYFTEHGYYDEETNEVKYFNGGIGDDWHWIVIDTEETKDSFVVKGLFLNNKCEDTTGKVENIDYYNYLNPYDNEYYLYNIDEAIEMTLVKDGTVEDYKVKIEAYEQSEYYIIDDTLYAFSEDRTKVTAHNQLELRPAEYTEFNIKDTYRFEGNDSVWYNAETGFAWECIADTGYQVGDVTVKTEKGTETAGASGTVSAGSGAVTLSSEVLATLTVKAQNAKVTFDNLTSETGVYTFGEDMTGISTRFTVIPEEGYQVVSVKLNGEDVSYLEPLEKYECHLQFSPMELFVTTEKIEEPEELDTTAPVAVIAPENIVGTTGEAITFSGVNSKDNIGVASYKWDFGDGSTGSGKICKHVYAKRGTYTVTLTVTDTSGNENSETKEVAIHQIIGEGADYALLTITAINGHKEGTPAIANANIQITGEGEDGFETLILTDENGKATAVVPRTKCNISAIAEGFAATSRVVNVKPDENGNFTYTISLMPAGVSLVDGSINAEPATLEDMEAAGIDINSVDNQNVTKTEFEVLFRGNVTTAFDISAFHNKDGDFLGGIGIGEWITISFTDEGKDDENDSDNPNLPDKPNIPDPDPEDKDDNYDYAGKSMKAIVFPITEKMYLVVYGETHWLKEMYNVELIVLNNSRVEDLTDCVAELELPSGLSLAKMIDEPQSEVVEFDTIEKFSEEKGTFNSASHTWYVRGDAVGEYNLTANVSGNITDGDGNATPFEESFTTSKPIRIYCGDALHLTITAQDTCYKGKPYYVKYSLKNTSDITLYNLSFAFTGTEQYEIARMSDQSEQFKYINSDDFGEDMCVTVKEFAPGQTVEFMFRTTTWFDDSFMEGMSGYLSGTTVEYELKDAFLTMAEGSTTSIPYEIKLEEVKKDSFFEWVDGQAESFVKGELDSMAIAVIDSRVANGIPVLKYGVKVLKYVIDEYGYKDAEASATVTTTGGAKITDSGALVKDETAEASTFAARTTSTEPCVIVYTDVPYELSEDGTSMTISQDATIYVARLGEGDAGVSITTCYNQNGIVGEDSMETITYELLANEEYSEELITAKDVELHALENAEFDIHYKDTITTAFTPLFKDAEGHYHMAAKNVTWSIEGKDTNGLSIDEDGVLTITPKAKAGTYTVKVTVEGTEKSATQEIVLTKIPCAHNFTKYVSNKDATCTVDGTKTASCDYGCGETDTVTDKGSAFGHSMSGWSTVTEPTYAKEGLEINVCTLCDYKEERVIPAIPKTNIAAPTSLKAVLYGYDDVKLTWKKSSGATGYVIYYKTTAMTDYTELAATTKLTYNAANLQGGEKYTFKVVPYKLNGKDKIESIYFSNVSVYTLMKLPAPTVTKVSSTKIKISWQNISGETGYQLSRSTSKTGTNIISTMSGTSKTISVTQNKNYYYKVRVYKTVNDTRIYSPWSSVTTYNLRYVKSMGNITAALYGYNDVKLSWKKVTGANAYDIYYKKSSAASYTKLRTTTSISYKIANLMDGVKYTFKVVPVYKSSGKNLLQGSAKTTSITTLKKLNAPALRKSSGKVKVSWNNIGGETGYQISRSTSMTGTNVVATYATTSGTYKNVSANKGITYYYKVRAYKTVNGKKIYGPWSDVSAFRLK